MNTWKTAALAAALTGAAGLGAAVAPVVHGQSGRSTVAPRAFELIAGGTHIGVSITDVEQGDAKAKGQGVLVEEVTDDSPAAKAGIRKGDVIVEFDGERVRSVRQFQRLVQETPAGRNVQAALLRDGQRTTVTLTPRQRDGLTIYRDGERLFGDSFTRILPTPVPPRTPSTPRPPALPDFETFVWAGGTTLGITTMGLGDQLGDYFGTKTGVLVTAVTRDSAAEKAGVKAGDVITSFNGSDVDSSAALRRRIQRLEGGDEFTINVMRDRKPLTLKGKLEPRRDPRRTIRT